MHCQPGGWDSEMALGLGNGAEPGQPHWKWTKRNTLGWGFWLQWLLMGSLASIWVEGEACRLLGWRGADTHFHQLYHFSYRYLPLSPYPFLVLPLPFSVLFISPFSCNAPFTFPPLASPSSLHFSSLRCFSFFSLLWCTFCIRLCYLYILNPRGVSANCPFREIIMQVKMIR